MEDFYYAGGLRALLAQLATVPGALHLDRRTVSGGTFGEQIAGVPVYDEDVIRTPEHALSAEGGVAVLRGNLAPDGAVIKHIAAEPRLLKHTGPAVVFDSYPEMQKQINDPALNVTADSVLVLRNAGPKGGPGMPEYGMLPIPDYLLAQGVRDMVRISDARMSGTSYGACVLHVAPEAFVGGPLALVRTGDLITLDAAARELRLEVSDAELAERRARGRRPQPKFERGYGALFSEQITQANKGCDFAFLARHGRNPTRSPNPRLLSHGSGDIRLQPVETEQESVMIQGFNPRTGEPAGQPVAETTDADVDAAAEAAAAALTPWAGLGDQGRARALEAVADALDARAGELVALADEETALGETRLTGEVARTTGQLRLFAGVLRDGSYADSGGQPGRRRDRGDPAGQPPGRAGGGVRGVQLPVRVLGGGRGHGLRAGRWLPGRGQGARGASADVGGDRADRGRGAGRGGRPGRGVRSGARVRGRYPAAHPSGDHRGRVHRLHPRRAGAGPGLRRAGRADPVLR